jgi:hypothetical protein
VVEHTQEQNQQGIITLSEVLIILVSAKTKGYIKQQVAM